ncbi:MAG: alkyl sulfatase dimerization domain-containing protein [Desulfosudaceae bacterium]
MKSKHLLIILAACLTAACAAHGPQRPAELKPELAAVPTLEEHSRIFRRGVERVTDNIHVAIGYGLANSILIEGEDGLIIVDTMETMEEAREVRDEFRKISDKPVRAIIYTHNHSDHIFGARVLAGHDSPDIIAHQTTHDLVNRVVSELRPATNIRAMRMFGTFLDKEGLVNAGIGPFLGVGRDDRTLGYIPPTITFTNHLSTEKAGIRLELIHAPGETDDQIYVWLPDQRVLICGDNFYWTFPNLYTIRGTPFRSLKQWYRSLDLIRQLRPEYLVPCHTRPIRGADKIYRVITDYRDAIQYIHDQTLRGINMGMTPDELAAAVELPPRLANAPYLRPFYGTVAWSVRAMFSGNMGWFDGDAATLNPLSRPEQARLMARLAGGESHLHAHAQQALANRDFQEALQLSGHLLRLSRDNPDYRNLRVRALTALGERAENPNARHYYLTEALEIRDDFVARSDIKPDKDMLRRFPLKNFFSSLQVYLDPDQSLDKNIRTLIKFPEEDTAFWIHVRYGVAEIKEVPLNFDTADTDLVVSAEAMLWKEMLAQVRGPLLTLPRFDYEKGSLLKFAAFMKMFTPPPAKLPCLEAERR